MRGVNMSDLCCEYNYLLPEGILRDFKSIANYVESNYLDDIEDMVLNGNYPFREYSVQFLYKKSVDTFKVRIEGNNQFNIEAYWGKDKMCSATYNISVDREINNTLYEITSIVPKGKGVLLVKRDRKGKDKLIRDVRNAIAFLFYCLVLTALKDTVYIERKGQHYIRSEHKDVEDMTYKIINLGNHKATDSDSSMRGIGAKHSYEYQVRGFWRTYKSGKKIWIDSYTKCKGRGPKPKTVNIVNVDKAKEIGKVDKVK